jgi:hypothetical protein
MDLETNASKGLADDNTMILQRGQVQEDAIVKIAQTFRSGTNDIDAIDFVDMFLNDDQQINIDDLRDLYVLVNFRPVVTNKNWRMDCGVAGYDNTFGLPPFFPTRLRFEDYIYRLWIQQEGIVAAHVDAAQHHTKSNYMRNPPASEVLNEEIANLLKKKIKTSLSNVDDLGIAFDYTGEVTASDAEEILGKFIGALWTQLKERRARTESTPSVSLRPILKKPSTGLSLISSNIICCASSMTLSQSSRHRSNSGQLSSRSAISKRFAMVSQCFVLVARRDS